MKKKCSVCHIMIVVFAVIFILGAVNINTEAKSKKKEVVSAGILIDPTAGTVNVTYKGTSICNAIYKEEVVYAYTDITFVRKGPGTKFSKVKNKKVKFDMGEKLVRIANIDNKWSIVVIDGKRYFVSNEHISVKAPTKKLSVKRYTSRQLKRKGVIHWGRWRWTWYSQRVLRGRGLHIPGRHVDTKGYVCDKNGYICLASSKLRKGTVVKTPFGKKGKVYDSGCSRRTLDVYTNF